MRSVVARALFCLMLCWIGVGTVRAETCPEIPDNEVALRRSMAKEWFAKAEESEAAGDRQAAVRRYACSLGLAPHPSTAYNLGTVAEKSGDLSAALDGFRTYLKLSPEAADRPSIEGRIVALEAKLAELRKALTPKAPPQAPAVSGWEASSAPVAEAPPALTPPPTGPVRQTDDDHPHLVAGWISLGGAAASLGVGVALNLMARSKMDDCYRLYRGMTPGALDQCANAKPLAYGSYALLGLGGALVATGAALLLWPSEAKAGEDTPKGTAGDTTDVDVALIPSAGGATLLATRRF
jgi:tetratricopeptide (TPR) repeat protein